MAERGLLAASDAGTGSVNLRSEIRAHALDRGAPLRFTLLPDLPAATRAGWFDKAGRAAVEASLVIAQMRDLGVVAVAQAATPSAAPAPASTTSPESSLPASGRISWSSAIHRKRSPKKTCRSSP